mgnify:CR=1 FL=1
MAEEEHVVEVEACEGEDNQIKVALMVDLEHPQLLLSFQEATH